MIISRAPFRVSFCGGGSDIAAFYEKFGGCVLSCSIRKYVYRNGKAVVITAHNIGDTNRYGFMLAHGFTSEAQNEPTLTFQIDGKWIRKHSVTVKPKDFIEQPVKSYLGSGQVNQDLETITQKKIDSLTKKYNKES